MNKPIIFLGIGSAAVAVIVVVALSGDAVKSMTLYEILENKDCTELERWGTEST